MVSVVIVELLSDSIMWPSDWFLSGSISGARKRRSTGKALKRTWSTTRCLRLASFIICIHCRSFREFCWRAGWGKSSSPVLRGALTFFHMAEYCDTLQSREERNREYKACLNERAILRLLDHKVTWEIRVFFSSWKRVTCHCSTVFVCGSFARHSLASSGFPWKKCLLATIATSFVNRV